jgi:hypothetical protein
LGRNNVNYANRVVNYAHRGEGKRRQNKRGFGSEKERLCVNTHTGYVYYSHGGPPSPHLIVQCTIAVRLVVVSGSGLCVVCVVLRDGLFCSHTHFRQLPHLRDDGGFGGPAAALSG